MEKRKVNVERMVKMARAFAKEYEETGVLDVVAYSYKDCPGVQVSHTQLDTVSPIETWTWSELGARCDNPWHASIVVDGVEFYAIFTDKEHAEVERGKE